MEREVAMIVSSLINNIGLLGNDEQVVNNTIEGIEILKKEWPTLQGYEEKELEVTCKVLKRVYGKQKN